MSKLKVNNIKRNINARGIVIAPEANGRLAVRDTFESNLRSNRSLITQPAPRISMAPTPNNINSKGSGKPPPLGAIDNAHQPGKSNNQVPMGRSMRTSLRYGLAAVGAILSTQLFLGISLFL